MRKVDQICDTVVHGVAGDSIRLRILKGNLQVVIRIDARDVAGDSIRLRILKVRYRDFHDMTERELQGTRSG